MLEIETNGTVSFNGLGPDGLCVENGLCCVLRLGPGLEPIACSVFPHNKAAQRPHRFLTLYKNTIRPGGGGGGGG